MNFMKLNAAPGNAIIYIYFNESQEYAVSIRHFGAVIPNYQTFLFINISA